MQQAMTNSFSGSLSDTYSVSMLGCIGGTFIGVGLLLSSFTTAIWQLYITYGLLFGIGISLSFMPSIAAVSYNSV